MRVMLASREYAAQVRRDQAWNEIRREYQRCPCGADLPDPVMTGPWIEVACPECGWAADWDISDASADYPAREL